jgi:hypothetical protein
MFFLNPFRSIQDDKKMRERRAKAALADKKSWEGLKPPGGRRDIGIIASTFRCENPLAKIFPKVPKDGLVYKDRLRYQLRDLPLYSGLEISGSPDLYHDGGRAYFDEPIQIPVLHYRTDNRWKGVDGWDTWMSITPHEMWSQRSGVQAATGRVILGGLGMGWLLRQISKKPTVKSIIVIEKDADLLEWFGKRVCAETPKVTDIICGDYWEHAHKMDLKKDRFIADIWPGHSDAEHDRDLAKLRATGAKVWAWGCVRPDWYHQRMINEEKAKMNPAERLAAEGLGE